MILDKLQKYIENGIHHIKCPLCNNPNIAKNKLRELLIFENLMHDGNEDFDINFKEPYYIEIQRIELHQSFENNIINKSDRCTIGSENPLEKEIDSVFINQVSSIISLENGNFVACSSNMIIVFELKEKKINYLIMRNILNDSLLTLCDLKISNLIAIGGEDLKIYQINQEKKELNLQKKYFYNKNINKIILTKGMNPQEFERFALCDKDGFISFYKIKKINDNVNFSIILKKKCHDFDINCIIYLKDEEILVSVSNGDKKLIFWEIQNQDLHLLKEFINNSSTFYNDSLLNLDKNLLVGEKDGIRVYHHEEKVITFSFFYKNEEFGSFYSIKYLGNNYFICGRSFGFCSIFKLKEKEKNIRKINIFRNNNVITSMKEFDIMNDNYFINNICVKKTSVATGDILISSVDRTLKIYSYAFHNNDYID